MQTDRCLRRASMALALIVAASLAGASLARACGERMAKHGGQVNEDQGEMNFELVQRARSVVLYLEDHGQPVLTKGSTARLYVKRGSTAWTAPVRPDGENRYVVSLRAGLLLGDSVAVDVQFPNGSIANGRFTFGVAPKPGRPTFAFAPAVRLPAP